VEWACLKAYPSSQIAIERQIVRRHRHDRGTSTVRATFTTITPPEREGTAVHPYAENSSSVHNNPTFITLKRDNAMRGGMWNGRASRRTRVSESKRRDKSSAGIGTTVEHPPCERMSYSRQSGRAQRPSPFTDIRFDKCLITKTETGRHRGLPARNAIFIMETSSVSLLCQLIPNDAHVFAVNIRAAAGLCPTDVRPLVCREAGM